MKLNKQYQKLLIFNFNKYASVAIIFGNKINAKKCWLNVESMGINKLWADVVRLDQNFGQPFTT